MTRREKNISSRFSQKETSKNHDYGVVVPIYSGYGVETGLLLALLECYGISGIAQVDLRRRIHHNQSLEALSRMAFAIIQVFVDHLEQRQRVELLSEINRTMKIIRYEMGSYELEEYASSDQCRPP